MRASPEITAWVESYYELMDTGRLDECERFFTPDATLQIAHNPPMVGYEAIDRAMRIGLSMVGDLRHEVKNVWEAEDGVLIFEVHAHYTLKDGRKQTVPGVVIGELEDGRFKGQRIGADLSVVYGNL